MGLSLKTYELIHLGAIIFLLTTLSITFFNTEKSFSLIKIFTGISSLALLLSGIGLMISHNYPLKSVFSLWLLLKILIWMVIAILGPIVVKRLPLLGKTFYWIMMLLALVAIYLAKSKEHAIFLQPAQNSSSVYPYP